MRKNIIFSFFIGSIALSLNLYSKTGPKGLVEYNPSTEQGTLTGPHGGQADLIGDPSSSSSGGGTLTIENGPYGGSASLSYVPNQSLNIYESNPSNSQALLIDATPSQVTGFTSNSKGNIQYSYDSTTGSKEVTVYPFNSSARFEMVYDPSTNTYTAKGYPSSGTTRTLTYDPGSYIYVSGQSGQNKKWISANYGGTDAITSINGYRGNSILLPEGAPVEIENSSGTVIAEGTGNYRTFGEGASTNQPATYSTNWTIENPVYGVFNSGETIDRTLTTPYVVNQGYYTAPTIQGAGYYVPGYYTAPTIQSGSVTATTSLGGDWTRTYSEASGLSFEVQNSSGTTGTANYVNGQLYFNGEPVTYDSSTSSFYYTGTQNPAELL